jgi:hypothetical protein
MIGPFLIKLVEYPEVLAAYMTDPAGAMDAEGLSPEEREIVLSGNLKRLRDKLQEEYPDKEIFLGQVPQYMGQVPQVQPPEQGDPGGS